MGRVYFKWKVSFVRHILSVVSGEIQNSQRVSGTQQFGKD